MNVRLRHGCEDPSVQEASLSTRLENEMRGSYIKLYVPILKDYGREGARVTDASTHAVLLIWNVGKVELMYGGQLIYPNIFGEKHSCSHCEVSSLMKIVMQLTSQVKLPSIRRDS